MLECSPASVYVCVCLHASERVFLAGPCTQPQVNQCGAAVARCSPPRRLCGSRNSCDGVSHPEDPLLLLRTHTHPVMAIAAESNSQQLVFFSLPYV